MLVIDIEDDVYDYEHNIHLWVSSFKLAFPEVHLRAESTTNKHIKQTSTVMINYFAAKDDDIDTLESEMLFTESDIAHLKKVNRIIIEENSSNIESRKNGNWGSSRWWYAYNMYHEACSSTSVESSVLSLITALESLVMQGAGDLTYRVSLFSSLLYAKEPDERSKVYALIKDMYVIRSKVSHGAIEEAVKRLRKPDFYDKYYMLKKVVSVLLVKLHGVSKEEVKKGIESMIFTCSEFTVIAKENE